MENWKKYLRESNQLEQAKPTPIIESNLKGMLLYHGTCFPPESFVDGIDPRRAHGFGQGEGFYFWTNKKRAINHTIGHILKGQNKQENCPEDADTGYIVISDEPVTPDNFDIVPERKKCKKCNPAQKYIISYFCFSFIIESKTLFILSKVSIYL